MLKNVNYFNKTIVLTSLFCSVQLAYAIDPHEGAAAVLNAPDELRNSAINTTTKISDQVSSVFAPAGVARATVQRNSSSLSGMAAGENARFPYRPGVWGNYSYSDIENDHDVINSDTDVDTYMIGIDSKLTENFLIGAVISYEDIDSTTKPDVNAFISIGATSLKSTVDKNATTFTFYAGYKFTDTLNLDASVGFTPDVDIDQTTRALSPFGNSFYKASSTNERTTIALNLNKFWISDSYVIEGHVGYLYTEEQQEAYVAVDTLNPAFAGVIQTPQDLTLEQLNLRGRVTMLYGNFEPYAGLTIEYDTNSADENYDFANGFIVASEQLKNDDTGIVVSAGFDYYFQNNSSLNFEISTVEARDDVDNVTAQVGYRYNF